MKDNRYRIPSSLICDSLTVHGPRALISEPAVSQINTGAYPMTRLAADLAVERIKELEAEAERSLEVLRATTKKLETDLLSGSLADNQTAYWTLSAEVHRLDQARARD